MNWFRTQEHNIRHYGGYVIGFSLIALFMLQATGIVRIGILERMELWSYDMRLNFTMPKSVFPGIAIVDIDEKSLAEEGRWPWGRDKMAKLTDQLFDRYQIAAAGFDIVFAEPDENSGLKVLEALGKNELRSVPQFHEVLDKLAPILDHDRLFAEKLKGRPAVLGYYFDTGAGQTRTSGALPPPTFPEGAFRQSDTVFVQAYGYGGNLKELQENASGGHFDPLPDIDGISRRVPMLIEYKGKYYGSLALELARAVMGGAEVDPVVKKSGDYAALEGLEVGGMKIPLDGNACALVPYRGERGSFKYFSASDVLHGRIDPAALSGKIVLVGTSAPGLMDLRSTPVGNVYPGVEIHANLLAGILEQNIKQRPAYATAVEMLTLAFAGLLLTWLLPKLSPVKSVFFTLAIVISIGAGNLYAWRHGLVLPLAAPVALILSIFVFEMLYGFFFETRAKRQMSGLFGQYVPPELVNEMSKNPTMFDMKSESREMTVLFSDIRDFTKMSEGLDPDQLSKLINSYLTPMTTIIHKNHGTIDKYIGDAIMAFWGAPVHDPEHAQHAVTAALEMQEALEKLNAEFKEKGWPKLKIGIGVNSGLMSVGNMGSEFRKAYTVMGDAVNLASRLEGLTKQYGVGIFVSDATMHAVKRVKFQEIDRVRVKGKIEPATIYVPHKGELSPSVEKFEEALGHYRNQQWDEAESILKVLQEEEDRLLYRVYLDRIAIFRETPPKEAWDGVFEMKTK
jgi:adenylate cyclase